MYSVSKAYLVIVSAFYRVCILNKRSHHQKSNMCIIEVSS